MKSQARLLKAVERAERMARGRLCVLSRAKGGGEFYHLQPAYKRATEAYRRFMALVDAFVDEMSAKCAAEIEKEAKDARGRAKAARHTASARIQVKAVEA